MVGMSFMNQMAGLEYIMGLCGIFVGVFLLLSGINHLVVQPLISKREIERRIQQGRREKLARVQILKAGEDEKSLFQVILEQLAGIGKIENLQRSLLQADMFIRPTTFLGIVGLLFCTGFCLLLIQGNPAPGVLIGGLLGCTPFLLVRFKKRRKSNLFEQQMPECMELLARSLRAGHALPSAIELCSKEVDAPLGVELKVVYEEQRLGLGVNEALKRMGDRVDCQDLQFFITAVMLQTETGGNLAEILENIGFLIRERLKLKGKIKALTAEGRFSAIILACLPFVVFGALTILNQNYINILFNEPVGFQLIAAGLMSLFMGIVWMKKIITIKV
jgi:tight adherence protein B